MFKKAFKTSTPITVKFSESKLAKRLQTIARIISINRAIGCRRQVFYVAMGGFDTHQNLLADHQQLMTELNIFGASALNISLSFIC